MRLISVWPEGGKYNVSLCAMGAKQVIEGLLNAVGEHEGCAGIESVASDGYQGELTPEETTVLIEEHGTAGDALYAIQLAAQYRVSAWSA